MAGEIDYTAGRFDGKPYEIHICEAPRLPFRLHSAAGSEAEAHVRARDLVAGGEAVTAEVREVKGAYRRLEVRHA